MALGSVIIACKDSAMCDKLAHTLAAAGIEVLGTATKGASALQKAARYYGDRGVLLCSYAMSDMTASELFRIMPEGFEMVVLLSARQRAIFGGGEMLCLDIPINRSDLVNTLRMLTEPQKPASVRPEKRSEGDREIIARAKALLMERNGMSEPDAHRFLQRQSMNSGQSLVSVALTILNGVL
ncbi:MAG: ANTAR domain-containing protein [Clostridia bacterium]|nr:ANTAR domain-containing protein [Clostridia bacterium]